MAPGAPAPVRYTSERYLGLVDAGVLGPDDRVELLEGVVVSMSPQNPPHAASTMRVHDALRAVFGAGTMFRVQMPFVAGAFSVPEPDVAVVAGCHGDYDARHPTTALMVVEVADSSLVQDRLTKSAIYAAAGVPEYWIVNLVDDCIEVLRAPDRETRTYGTRIVAHRGEQLAPVAAGGAAVAVDDLLPSR